MLTLDRCGLPAGAFLLIRGKLLYVEIGGNSEPLHKKEGAVAVASYGPNFQ